MKLLTRKAFLDMPAGTIFAKGKPCYFESLSVKGDTTRNDQGVALDFFSRSLVFFESMGNIGEAWARLEAGESLPIDPYEQRDGCFDDEDRFLIFEAADLEGLAETIAAARNTPKTG